MHGLELRYVLSRCTMSFHQFLVFIIIQSIPRCPPPNNLLAFPNPLHVSFDVDIVVDGDTIVPSRNTPITLPRFMPFLSRKDLNYAVASSTDDPFAVRAPDDVADTFAAHYPVTRDLLRT